MDLVWYEAAINNNASTNVTFIARTEENQNKKNYRFFSIRRQPHAYVEVFSVIRLCRLLCTQFLFF